MDYLKEQIVKKLEGLPENALHEILNFVEFLESQNKTSQKPEFSIASVYLEEECDVGWLQTDLSNLGSYEPYDWQPGELGKGLPVKYVPGMGVVIVEE
ncbi:hypothetical protein BV372_34800 [Nostoc sp. T09]|uniref:DUF2281 domain-containing protein n=1 Tax=Nostoc sp. T09 TaxID=1932621 RepID=UPI000A36C508|nr:DUF2281 domain-containing protein [Nostoc sp. T09]OUL17650.1 hypothetical protein BV372_34800 [Nostoc sp. T09]